MNIAKKAYSSLACDYEITMDRITEVEEVKHSLYWSFRLADDSPSAWIPVGYQPSNTTLFLFLTSHSVRAEPSLVRSFKFPPSSPTDHCQMSLLWSIMSATSPRSKPSLANLQQSVNLPWLIRVAIAACLLSGASRPRIGKRWITLFSPQRG